MTEQELQTENAKLKRYIEILERCLDTKDELCKVLREDNEKLRNELEKLEIKTVINDKELLNEVFRITSP